MSTTPLAFTGVSKYSSDLQTILQRAVSIASLPLTQIQNQQSDVLAKKQQLGDLSVTVQALGSALSNLATVGDRKAISATSSNALRVSVAASSSAQAGLHSIANITSVARAASESTVSGYATADSTTVAPSGSLELALGSKTYPITLGAGKNNLNGVRDAINALGLGVTATVLNTGNATNPYYLSVNATNTGKTTLELRTTAGDPGSDILSTTNQGANAEFQLDGVPISKTDNVISDLVPGVTFTILSQTNPGEQVSLNLASDRGSLVNALNSFVSAYNSTVTKVSGQVGKNAGMLQGDFIVRQVQSTLHSLTGFSGSGEVKSLADLGVTLDRTGKMSFDQNAVYSLSTSGVSAAFSFLNNSSGVGQLSSKLTTLTDPVTGLIQVQQDQYDATDTRLTSEAGALQARITTMQANMTTQLQAADALLASLDNQQSVLTGSINSLNYAVFGKVSSN